MFLSAVEPDVYPDLAGVADPSSGELSAIDRALLREIEVEVPKTKKPKGSRSRPKRGHKKPARRKKTNRRKTTQGG